MVGLPSLRNDCHNIKHAAPVTSSTMLSISGTRILNMIQQVHGEKLLYHLDNSLEFFHVNLGNTLPKNRVLGLRLVFEQLLGECGAVASTPGNSPGLNPEDIARDLEICHVKSCCKSVRNWYFPGFTLSKGQWCFCTFFSRQNSEMASFECPISIRAKIGLEICVSDIEHHKKSDPSHSLFTDAHTKTECYRDA